jgi:hypothetical protein
LQGLGFKNIDGLKDFIKKKELPDIETIKNQKDFDALIETIKNCR